MIYFFRNVASPFKAYIWKKNFANIIFLTILFVCSWCYKSHRICCPSVVHSLAWSGVGAGCHVAGKFILYSHRSRCIMVKEIKIFCYNITLIKDSRCGIFQTCRWRRILFCPKIKCLLYCYCPIWYYCVSFCCKFVLKKFMPVMICCCYLEEWNLYLTTIPQRGGE